MNRFSTKMTIIKWGEVHVRGGEGGEPRRDRKILRVECNYVNGGRIGGVERDPNHFTLWEHRIAFLPFSSYLAKSIRFS